MLESKISKVKKNEINENYRVSNYFNLFLRRTIRTKDVIEIFITLATLVKNAFETF